MFLTNNCPSIRNFIVYTECKYINRIIIKKENIESPTKLIEYIQEGYKKYFVNSSNYNNIPFFISLRPYGNIKKQSYVRIFSNKSVVFKIQGEDF